MVVFVGQVGNDFVEREAFQEIDYRRMYGPITKWVAQIDRTERIPEYVSHAFHTAMAGRPGPGAARAARGHAVRARPRWPTCRTTRRVRPAPSRRRPARTAQAAAGARSVPSCSSAAAAGIARACDGAARLGWRRAQLPVGTSFRCQDLLDNRSPSLRGRRRHRHQPEARAAREGGGRGARHRRAPGRDDHRRLHAVRGAGAEARRSIHVHARRGGAGARLSARRCRSIRAWRSFVVALCAGEARRREVGNAHDQAREEYLAWNEPHADARQAAVRRGDRMAVARTCPRTRSSPTARAISPAGCTATSATRGCARSSARPTARWATACPRRWRRSSPRRSARWWPSPATATSS